MHVARIFYKELERDRWAPYDRYPRRIVRRILRGRQLSGFGRRLDSLRRGLSNLGVPHILNDFRGLGKNPDQAIGLLGKPHLLDGWRWPNPLVCGPALLDHPKDRPDLFKRFNVRIYLVAGPWMKKMFEPYFRDRVQIWPIGIDTDLWADFSNEDKTVDFLIYEKFLWDQTANRCRILNPITAELRRRNLTWNHILCGTYSQDDYLAKLRRARRMLFLCEHETQGQAYQEALSCNLPVLAWNQGLWLDPKSRKYENKPVVASSVPYFSPECGVTFRTVEEFPTALDRFLWGEYHPREFIKQNLGLSQSAKLYLDYLNLAERMGPG